MEFLYAYLMAHAKLVEAKRAHEERVQHNGEYDHAHSPEAYYITEEEWVNASSQLRTNE